MPLVRLKRDLAPLIPRFQENRRTDLLRFEAMVMASDLKGLADLAHSLKGVAGSFGFEELAALAVKIQLAVGLEDAAELKRLVVELRDHLGGLEVVYI